MQPDRLQVLIVVRLRYRRHSEAFSTLIVINELLEIEVISLNKLVEVVSELTPLRRKDLSSAQVHLAVFIQISDRDHLAEVGPCGALAGVCLLTEYFLSLGDDLLLGPCNQKLGVGLPDSLELKLRALTIRRQSWLLKLYNYLP